MAFEIVRNDIVNMAVDAIVNTANPRPEIGSGTDAAIHAKAGPLLLRSRRLIGTIKTGEAAITLGFGLPAKFVIHAVGPVWQGGDQGEPDLLRRCYDNVLKLAWRHRIKSLAIPLISTGNYGFPKALALEIAVEAIRDFLREQEMQIYLVVFEREAFLRSRKRKSGRNWLRSTSWSPAGPWRPAVRCLRCCVRPVRCPLSGRRRNPAKNLSVFSIAENWAGCFRGWMPAFPKLCCG